MSSVRTGEGAAGRGGDAGAKGAIAASAGAGAVDGHARRDEVLRAPAAGAQLLVVVGRRRVPATRPDGKRETSQERRKERRWEKSGGNDNKRAQVLLDTDT